mgnify:CR=1 FL=1
MPLTWAQKKEAWRLYGGVAKKIAAQTIASTGVINYGASKAAKYYSSTKKTGKSIVKMGKARRATGKPRVKARVLKITRVKKKPKGPVPKSRLSTIKKRYPQMLSQTYYLTSESSYLDVGSSGNQGTITNPDSIYSTPSVKFDNASIMLFNVSVTENHWTPQGVVASQGIGYRTGIQVCPVDSSSGPPGYGELTSQNDSFIYRNNANSTALVSSPCPFKQNGLAEPATDYISGSGPSNSTFTCPNNVLKSVDINIKVHNPLIAPQYLTIKLVRASNGEETPLKPGQFGLTQDDANAQVNSLCNARSWTDPHKFKQVWQHTVRMDGMRSGTKLKHHTIRKSISLEYLRSQYRKTYNANSLATLGLQAKPSFGLVDDGFFNACYIVVSSTLTDNEYIATVEVEKNATNPESKETGIPQLATYPPTGLGVDGYRVIGEGAQFGISGTITVNHRVQSIRRAIGSSELAAVQLLQEQIDCLKIETEKTKNRKLKYDSDSE